MKARHVVFDIGNVLLRWDPRFLFEGLFAGRAAQMEWFLDHICTPAWNLEQDGGRTWAEGVGVLVAQYPEWRVEIEAFDRRWHDMIPHVITGSVDLLTRLKRLGVRLYAVTNFSSEKYAETSARYSFLSAFEGVVVSGDERLLKPAAPIFELLCARYAIDPRDCVFIDDNADNVAGAATLGMAAILFTDPEALEVALRHQGFAL